jgi:hypothetical protein
VVCANQKEGDEVKETKHRINKWMHNLTTFEEGLSESRSDPDPEAEYAYIESAERLLSEASVLLCSYAGQLSKKESRN